MKKKKKVRSGRKKKQLTKFLPLASSKNETLIFDWGKRMLSLHRFSVVSASSAPLQGSRGSIRAPTHVNSRNAAKSKARIPLVSKPIAAAAATSRSFLLGDDDDDDLPPTRTAADYALLLSQAEQERDWVRAVELVAEARVLRVKLTTESFEAAARVAADEGDWEKAAAFLARAMISPSLVAEDDESSLSPPPPPPPACSAIVAVFSRLAREVQAEAMMELLEMLRGGDDDDDDEEEGEGGDSSSSSSSSSSAWRSRPAETRSITLNCAARACARASTGGAKMMSQNDDGSDKKSKNGNEREQQQLSDEDRTIFFESSLQLLDDLREEGLRIEDGTFGAVALAALAAGRPDLSEELLEERDYL